MRKTERLEDLGRIREKLDLIFDQDYLKSIYAISEDEFLLIYCHPEKLRSLFTDLSQLSCILDRIYCIACGDDDN